MNSKSSLVLLAVLASTAVAANPPPEQSNDIFGRANLQVQSEFEATGTGFFVITNGDTAIRYGGKVIATAEELDPVTGIPVEVLYTLDAGVRGKVVAIGIPDPETFALINGRECPYTLDIPAEIQQTDSWLLLPNGKTKSPKGEFLIRLVANACNGHERAEIVSGGIRGLQF